MRKLFCITILFLLLFSNANAQMVRGNGNSLQRTGIKDAIQAELIDRDWQELVTNGPIPNTRDQEIFCMKEFNGKLYLGMYTGFYDSYLNAASLYSYDGQTLSLVHTFGSSYSSVGHFNSVSDLQVYKGELYAGVSGATVGDGDIWKYTPTVTGYKLDFPYSTAAGTTTKVTIPNDSNNNAMFGATAFSVEWYGTVLSKGGNGAGLGFSRMISKYNGSNSGYILGLNNNYFLRWRNIISGVSKETIVSSPAINPGDLTHVVVTWTDGAAAKIYINGTEASYSTSTVASTPSDDTAGSLILGNDASNITNIDGDFYRVRIYRNKALSAGEVTTLYGGGTVAGVTGEYLFTDGSGTTVTDSSGNGNNGTITGATWNDLTWTKVYNSSSDYFAYKSVLFNGNMFWGMGYLASRLVKYDGTSWTVPYSGYAGAGMGSALGVHKGNLYFGLGTGAGKADILKSSDGSTFTLDYDTTVESEVKAFVDFKGTLYTGFSGSGSIYKRNDATGTWSLAVDTCDTLAASLEVYNNRMYVGCGNATGDADVYVSNNGTSWTKDLDMGNLEEVYSMQQYNGSLYAGTGFLTGTTKATLWRKTDSTGNLSSKRVMIDNALYMGNDNKDMTSLNVATPINARSNIVVDGLIYASSLYGATAGNGSGKLLFMSADGKIYAP